MAPLTQQPDELATTLLTCLLPVAAGAKIPGGVTIGDDANIGANAVVLSDIYSQRRHSL